MSVNPGDVPNFPMARCPFAPPKEYAELRAEKPVARVRLPDGTPAWIVTRHADVRAVLGDRRFSTVPSTPGYPFVAPARASLLKNETPPTFIRMDPPDHTKYRRMLTKEFMVQHIASMRPFIEETVDKLLDDMARKGPPCDLVQSFALPFPSTVIATMLGVPYEDHDFFQVRSQQKLDMTADPEVPLRASAEMREYIDRLIDKKMKDPGNRSDLISRLITSQVVPGHMTREEAMGTIELLLMAGHETTGNMITLSTLSFLLNPTQKDEIVANPSLVNNAVEELLRLHTIVHYNGARVALEDVQVGDQLIKQGEGVIALISAANRDPEAFPEPDKFDVHREARHHLAFSYGVHQCLGQPLARAELQTVFSKLFQKFPDLRLAVPIEEVKFRDEAFVYGVDELPVTWTPKRKKFFTVDASKCVGGGLCVMAAPKVFAQSEDDGLVVVLQEDPSPDLHESIREAARLCPASVIKIEE